MTWLVLAGLLIFVCFVGVIFVGAPYLPTLTPQVTTAIKLADLRAGDTLLELGCGDGKVVLAAARQGLSVVGYELNPLLVLVVRLRTWRYRQHVRIIWGNYWHQSWPPAEAIFVFLLPKYMNKLHKKCLQYNYRPVKLVSFAFTIPGQHLSNEKHGVYLYRYS